NLPMAVPHGFQFAGASELVLAVTQFPVQIAAPVPASIPTGGHIQPMRATPPPDAAGNTWPPPAADDNTRGGAGPHVHTPAPPRPGIEVGGTYVYGYGPDDTVSVVKGKITVLSPVGVPDDSFFTATAEDASGGTEVSAVGLLSTGVALAITFDASDLKVQLI